VAGVMAATIAANLLGDRGIWSSIFFAAANAGEATVVAGLIQRFYRSPFELNGLRQVLGLFASTIGATIASGIVGTLGFVFFHGSTASFRPYGFTGLPRRTRHHNDRAAHNRIRVTFARRSAKTRNRGRNTVARGGHRFVRIPDPFTIERGLSELAIAVLCR
jgi:hypothetical protein